MPKTKINERMINIKQKLGSLKYQITQKMQELKRFGESKHEAKFKYRQACEAAGVKWNPSKAHGIFSKNTFESYQQTGVEFTAWLKENHADIKDINNVTRDNIKEYLIYRETSEKSAWTVSKDMAALNKIFSYNLSKAEVGLRERSYKDVERSRGIKAHDSKYNPYNYKNQISFAKAFGCRRESIRGGSYQVKEISLFKNAEGKIFCSLIEKGGRYREAPCLQAYQNEINSLFPNVEYRESITKVEFVKMYTESQRDKLFDSYTTKIDNHAFRAEYARARYEELIQEKSDVKNDYRGYDKEVIRQVSIDLGHNRPSVVVEHYLR